MFTDMLVLFFPPSHLQSSSSNIKYRDVRFAGKTPTPQTLATSQKPEDIPAPTPKSTNEVVVVKGDELLLEKEVVILSEDCSTNSSKVNESTLIFFSDTVQMSKCDSLEPAMPSTSLGATPIVCQSNSASNSGGGGVSKDVAMQKACSASDGVDKVCGEENVDVLASVGLATSTVDDGEPEETMQSLKEKDDGAAVTTETSAETSAKLCSTQCPLKEGDTIYNLLVNHV